MIQPFIHQEMYSESLYHTLYETYYLVDQLYDRGFKFHRSVAQLFGVIGVYLADQEVRFCAYTSNGKVRSMVRYSSNLVNFLDNVHNLACI